MIPPLLHGQLLQATQWRVCRNVMSNLNEKMQSLVIGGGAAVIGS